MPLLSPKNENLPIAMFPGNIGNQGSVGAIALYQSKQERLEA